MSFFTKLKLEKKLQIVEQSKEVCQAYLEKSDKSLKSAKATYGIESYEDSVALAYYSMYHALLALLYKIGVKCENHTAAIQLLKLVFSINNESIEMAKAERVDKQYYVDFSVTREEVNKTIKTAEQFKADMFAFIDSLSNAQVESYRQKAERLLG